MASSGDELYKPIFQNGVYICPWRKFEKLSLLNILRWKCMERHTNLPSSSKDLDKTLPINKTDYMKLRDPPASEVQVLWVGHASLIVQLDGATILTDPVFSDRIGPSFVTKLPLISRFTMKRYRKAPFSVKQLQEAGIKVDAVVISHDHYDHLDVPSVMDINRCFPDMQWFVPAGMKRWCISTGCKVESVKELSWWEQGTLTCGDKTIKFISTPAQHWCLRTPIDENKTLWCSWSIIGPTKKVFFAGDTGYFKSAFKQIGDNLGPFDLSLIPIGAYEPRFYLEYQHIDPVEAVHIHTDVKSRCSIGMHWGTFQTMSLEFYLEPRMKVAEELKSRGMKKDEFITLCHGEAWVVGEARKDVEEHLD